MNDLHRVMVIGAALGVSSQMASLFPEPNRTKQLTEADMRRIALAEQKRLRREARNRKLTHDPKSARHP
ncbi:hypothetical protein [Stutzerimonas stutzeri]|uniref:hypothetical protein n=1 Tax=Stutzerimonas stutzeri TaxID=316 RepID=UPI000380A686|nr:hypothetical protein [Stutzerimonas stutzeri]